MILTLEVTGSQAAKLGAARRKTFNASGGTIGRLRDNYWSLPDPYVSSRHAVIRYTNGAFFIEDTSTNGVFINRTDNRLVKGQPYQLNDNDLIFIEPYEIRATIEADVVASTPGFPADPFSPGSSGAPYVPEPIIPPDDSHEIVDPLQLLGGGSPSARPRGDAPAAKDLQAVSPWQESYRAPEVTPASPPTPPSSASLGPIPTNYDPFADDAGSSSRTPAVPAPASTAKPRRADPPAIPDDDWLSPPAAARPEPPPAEPRRPEPAPRPSPPSRVASPRPAPAPAQRAPAVNDSIAQLLKGAGIDPTAFTPELAEDFGRILRLVVGGVMDVLQARQRIKSEFRMDMTTFRPADNNPLKFSANVDDALHNLLVKRNAAFLNPVDAFEDAFDDIRNHQVAMLAGMRVAFEAMLAQFDPQQLQEEFDRQKHGALIAVPAKLRYWDLYSARFRDMVKDADAAFRELFGDEFAAAYEQQLKRLKSRSRDNEQ